MNVRALSVRAVACLGVVLLLLATSVAVAPIASALSAITQTGTGTGSTNVGGSSAFTDQITVTGSDGGTVAFLTGVTSLALTVSGGGAITTTGTLAAGAYTVSGTDSDGSGDTGSWTYTLTVSASTITQASPTAGSAPVASSSGFASQLNVTGNNGTVAFLTGVTSPALTVSGGGAITTTGTLAAGAYTVSGTDSDGSGDTGSWTYTLTVSASTITQASPTAGSAPVASSSGFASQLNVTGNNGTVAYTQNSSSSTLLSVKSTGAVSVSGLLAVGTYTVSGTDSDGSGDTGSWTYTLTVSASTITQASPTAGSTPVASSNGFTSQLNVSGNVGTVTYTQNSSSSTLLSVNSTGAVSVSGLLAVGSYTVSGTDGDTSGDSGSFSYTLGVTASTMSQVAPTTGVTTVNSSNGFTSQLNVTGNHGVVTYTATGGDMTHLLASSSGVISTNGILAAGGYAVSGTARDASGDTGTWTYALTVNAPPLTVGTVINQTSVTSGATTTAASASFVIGPIVVGNAVGTVTFVTTTSSAGLNVSPNGDITTSGTLAPGIYIVSGTDKDAQGDSGTWQYKLTVNAVATHTVTFSANGGTGAMAVESESAPTALALNAFKRVGFAFTQWNTAANGSGSNFADGATYPFSSSTTLYAQWKVEKRAKKPAIHAVTFKANGGSGTMAAERGKAPAALTPNRFRRTGYTFTQWNTAANGTGSNFANRAKYPFTSSVALYAQWSKVAKKTKKNSVTFNANRGTGVMATESESSPAALTPNRFRRTGYTFTHWNTARNGSGSSYSNGAVFPFTSSTTLFAQWKVKKVVVKPAIHAVVTLSAFAVKSSALSAALTAQIESLAREIKANRDTKIALVGYGDTLSAANQLNESAWAANFTLSEQRATSVETFLEAQLKSLGVSAYTITAIGNGTANPGSTGETAAEQAKNRHVIATIT